jgi:hypothetical protein
MTRPGSTREMSEFQELWLVEIPEAVRLTRGPNQNRLRTMGVSTGEG